MSCVSLDDVDGRRGRRAGESAAGEEGPALDMLDEYWFFSNTLRKVDGRGQRRPPLLPRSPSTSSSTSGKGAGAKGGASEGQAGKSRFYSRRLLRTPSLPSPRVGMEELVKDDEIAEEAEAAGGGGDEEVEVEVEDDDMNWSSIYEGILRTRIAGEGGGGRSAAALNRAPSMPVPSSATMSNDEAAAATTKSTPSMPRLRHSHSTLERHCRSQTPTKAYRTPTTPGGGVQWGQARRELRSFSASQQPAMVRQTSALIQDKKWKSSSALESIEVQGFKDLGFVFDEEELRESLADVLPGLRDSKSKPNKSSGSGSGSASDNDDANRGGIGIGNASSDVGDGIVRRPYLSEAWHHGARSAPPAAAAAGGTAIRLQQADARSAAEMKVGAGRRVQRPTGVLNGRRPPYAEQSLKDGSNTHALSSI